MRLFANSLSLSWGGEGGLISTCCVQVDLVDEIGEIDTCPEKRKLEVTAGLSNSFGFGGHNSVVIFAPYKE